MKICDGNTMQKANCGVANSFFIKFEVLSKAVGKQLFFDLRHFVVQHGLTLLLDMRASEINIKLYMGLLINKTYLKMSYSNYPRYHFICKKSRNSNKVRLMVKHIVMLLLSF